jgi:hypothetical protein
MERGTLLAGQRQKTFFRLDQPQAGRTTENTKSCASSGFVRHSVLLAAPFHRPESRKR